MRLLPKGILENFQPQIFLATQALYRPKSRDLPENVL
jgi:hypothetical protein